MQTKKLVGLSIAAIGLIISAGLMIGAYRFYRTVKALGTQNPMLHAPQDTLTTEDIHDSISELSADHNRQIASYLQKHPSSEQAGKQILLHETISQCLHGLDSLMAMETLDASGLLALKNLINKTNLQCRACLFKATDVEQIEALKILLIPRETELKNTIFECVSTHNKACFGKIKDEVRRLETAILEKNLTQLNL